METETDYVALLELMDKQLQYAQAIQKKIIPKSHAFISDYYHFYAHLKPFHHVGGDFYDFLTCPDQRVNLLLADASGHGIDAAMITGMIKLIFSYALKNPMLLNSPSALLKQIDAEIEQLLPSTFFSAFSVLLDPHEHTLTFSNAGHPTGILIRKNISFLLPTLPLLGTHKLMSTLNYNDVTETFKSGDKLILFTDGLIDTQNQNKECFSIDKILSIIDAMKTASIQVICEHLIAENEHFRFGDACDDICLLGIEYDN